MLRIKDEDSNFSCVEKVKYKGVNTLIIVDTYSPEPVVCKYCQSYANGEDGNKTIVKKGKSDCSFRVISRYSNYFKVKKTTIFL